MRRRRRAELDDEFDARMLSLMIAGGLLAITLALYVRAFIYVVGQPYEFERTGRRVHVEHEEAAACDA